MLNVGLAVRVKFRALGVTFGTTEKAWKLEASASGIMPREIPWNQVPANAREIYDNRGLWVRVWLG